MQAATQKIQYLTKYTSVAAMSRESGIPYRLLLDIKRGKRPLPANYKKSFTNMYNRKTYQILRLSGTPSRLASRLRGKNPEYVEQVSEAWVYKIDQWTRGAVLRKLGRKRINWNDKEIKKLYNEMKEKITKSLSASYKEFETFDKKDTKY